MSKSLSRISQKAHQRFSQGEHLRTFPDNKRFAFSICDDTDHSTLENVRPVYQFIADLGFRTTKLVWPLGPVLAAHIGGDSLQDKAYLNFVHSLQRDGFEIGLHNVQNHDATREAVEQGFREFRELTGQYPRIHCNHSRNRDNIYWGDQRFTRSTVRLAYNLANGFSTRNYFKGHVRDSRYFWGDICQERITYVRNLAFDEINLDRINPTMPYHDPSKPYVNLWFSSSDGANVDSFCKMVSEANQDQLEAEGGVCIMYTHFASGFWRDGVLDERFTRLMKMLANRDGWFVPVSTLLDHLRSYRGGDHNIPDQELANMERRWLLSKLRRGHS